MANSDKTFLVVGGTSGIGRAVVHDLLEKDARVIVAARHAPDDDLSDRVEFITLDVTDSEDSLAELPDTLHGLVYCPGSINLKPFTVLKPDDFLADFEINVLGAVRVIKAALKSLRAAKGASVVLYSTVAVQLGLNYHTSVATAKGALEGLGRSLAAELASKQVRVNLIAPSLTDTPLAKNLLGTDDKKEASRQRHPLGRYGEAEDIARATVFLLSGDSSWITGQVLHVDGGLSTLKPL